MRGNQVRSFVSGVVLAAGLAVAAGPVTAASTVSGAKFGDEFIVSTTTRDQQTSPRIAADALGNTVAVWFDDTAATGTRLLGQHFDAGGRRVGSEFLIHDSAIDGGCNTREVKMTPQGDFTVLCGFTLHLYAAGATTKRSVVDLGPTLLADHGGGFSIFYGALAMDADGGMALLYAADAGNGNCETAVFVRRFNADGTSRGGALRLFDGFNCGQSISQNTSIAASARGDLVVAASVQPAEANRRFPDDARIEYRRIAADGTLGPRIAVTAAQDAGYVRWIDMDAQGRIALLSHGFTNVGPSEVYSERLSFFGANNTRFAADTVISDCDVHQVRRNARGDTVATCSRLFTGTGDGVFFQRFSESGTALDAAPVRVSTTAQGIGDHGHQGGYAEMDLALDADGDFTLVWTDRRAPVGDTPQDDVRGQRVVGPENVDLTLVMEDSADPVAPSGTYNYRYNVSNLHAQVTPVAGSGAGIQAINRAIGSAHDIRVSSAQASNVTLGAGSGTDWNCTRSGSILNCNYLKALIAGTTAPTLQIAATAPSSGATVEQSGVVDIAYQPDSAQPNNSDCEATLVGTGSAPAGCGSAGPVSVSFDLASSEKTEPSSSAFAPHNITVKLSRAASSPVSVPFTISGTATSDADYSGVSSTPVNFATGATTATISLNVFSDQVTEPNETVIFTLGTPTGATLGSPAAHTLTIKDTAPPSNNPPSFTSTPNPTSATIGTAYAYNITVTDPDAGDTLTVIGGTLPGWLSVTNNSNGPRTARLSGTPPCGSTNATISLQVSDGRGGTATQSFALNMNGSTSCEAQPPPEGCNTSNSPSFATAPPATVQVNTPTTYTLRVNNPLGNPLTFSAPRLPSCLRLLENSGQANTRNLSGIVDVGCIASGLSVSVEVTDTQGCRVTQEFSLVTVGTDIETLTDNLGAAVELIADAGRLDNVGRLTSTQQAAMTLPQNVRLTSGLYAFNLKDVPIGGTAKVAVKFAGAADRYVKCKDNNCTQFPNAQVSNGLAILTLTDGGAGDADGVANGVIADPGGPALPGNGSGSSDGQGVVTIIEEPARPVVAVVDEDDGGGAFGSLLLMLALPGLWRRARASRLI